jgi:ATP-dependent RNA helicase DeaD
VTDPELNPNGSIDWGECRTCRARIKNPYFCKKFARGYSLVTHTLHTLSKFQELGLSEQISKSLPELGIETPTEIQEKSLPLLLGGQKDLVALAQTGTGKTAAFGLPLLDLIDEEEREVQALILSPTRELGQQIADQISKFSKYKRGIKSLAVYGGANIVPQIRALKGKIHIVIATPGRLIDLIDRRAISLESIKYLILDEADEMLTMGFKEDIDKILKGTPAEKSTWLFSATMPKEIRRIITNYMDKDFKEVTVNPSQQVNKNIEHQYVIINRDNKLDSLCGFLEADTEARGIIFSRTKLGAQKLAEQLRGQGQQADSLHGDLSQSQRDRVMKQFKGGTLRVLVATDVAARGIDVADLNFVIHYNLPDQLEYYTHRSGRTGRAGKKGVSISFISRGEKRKINTLQRDLDVSFREIAPPSAADLIELRVNKWAKEVLDASVRTGVEESLLEKVYEKFGELSKEQLLEQLVSVIVNDIQSAARKVRDESMSERGDRKDRNERSDRGGDRAPRGRDRDRGDRRDRDRPERGDRRERPDRAERPERRERKDRDFSSDRPDDRSRQDRGPKKTTAGMHRYFINIGKRDDIRAGDLVNFICEEARIGKGDIGDIEIDRNHSYFEVTEDKSGKINSSFQGIEIDGRELRVNRDGDQSGDSDSGKKSDKKDKE